MQVVPEQPLAGSLRLTEINFGNGNLESLQSCDDAWVSHWVVLDLLRDIPFNNRAGFVPHTSQSKVSAQCLGSLVANAVLKASLDALHDC